MKTRLTLRPGQRGTKRLLAEHGDRLVCVRYRYDEERGVRVKTVELVVEESPWRYCRPWRPVAFDQRVLVAVHYGDRELRRDIQRAGGKWRPEEGAWELPYGAAENLGIHGLVVMERATKPSGRGLWAPKRVGQG